MPHNSLTVGIVGLGRIGADHARTLRSLDIVGDIVVADIVDEVTRTIATELEASVATPDTILDQVDALVIATPTGDHAEHIIAAAEDGVPVFTEKPLALDIASTRQVIAAVERTGNLTQVGFMRRFDPGYANARRLLRDNAIGELRRANLISGDTPAPPASYIATSGGIFKDCTIHDIDALRWTTGLEIVEVYVAGANRGEPYFADLGDVDEAGGVLTLEDGTIATFQVSRYNGAGYDARMELFGTADTISAGFSTFTPITSAEPGVAGSPDGQRFTSFYSRFASAYAAEITTFIGTVHRHGTSVATVQDAFEALYVCEALDRSLAEHRPVRVDEVRTSS